MPSILAKRAVTVAYLAHVLSIGDIMKSQNYIDGQWVGASDGQTFVQRNPADLEHVTGEWPQGTRADAEQAIEAAHAAFPAWADMGVYQRAEYLSRAVTVLKGRTEEIAAILTAENGKPFNWFVDEGRTCRDASGWPSLRSRLQSMVWGYSLDRWQFQPQRVEVWIEKDAILGVMEPVCEAWQVPLYSCRGRPSLTMLYEAFQNFPSVFEGKRTTILYFGDHDPTGRDIPRGIAERIEALQGPLDDLRKEVAIVWCAITKEQVEQYNLPTRPTKTGKGQPNAVAFGESVEIDALPPNQLRAIVEAAIEQEIDAELWQQVEDRENREKGFLQRLEHDLLEQERAFNT